MMSLKPNILLVNLKKIHSEISFYICTSWNTFRKKILLKKGYHSIMTMKHHTSKIDKRSIVKWLQICRVKNIVYPSTLQENSFSHTRQCMIEQANEIQLWMIPCVLHITWQLYYICHVTSIVFRCFQGRPNQLAPLTSLWRHDFSSVTHSATDRRSIFRNLFNESVFYGVFGVVLQFVLVEQTNLLDAEFKYLIIFSIWVKSTLVSWNRNNSSPN